MYKKTVENIPAKKIRFEESTDVAKPTERSVTPPPKEAPVDGGKKNHSPYVDTPPSGYDELYSHTPGRSLDIPTYSPNGTKKKRRRHEGHYHLYLKTDGLTYHEGKIPRTPERQVHAVVVKSLNLSRRFKEDKKIFAQDYSLDAAHLRFAKEQLQETLDLILKIYLACQNPQDYIDNLNQRIRDGEFLNLFQLKLVYDKSTTTRFPYQSAHALLRSDISKEDVKLVLFDQLQRLSAEADQDHKLFTANDPDFTTHAKKTVEFAKSCMKKIAEFCRFFTEAEIVQFLKELNSHDFYHPNMLLSLYLDDCTNYDIVKSDSGLCSCDVSLLDIASVPKDSMRRTFSYEPLTPKAHTMTHTVVHETIEIFDKHGALRSRQKRKVTTTQGACFFSPAGVDEYDDTQCKDDVDRLIPSSKK